MIEEPMANHGNFLLWSRFQPLSQFRSAGFDSLAIYRELSIVFVPSMFKIVEIYAWAEFSSEDIYRTSGVCWRIRDFFRVRQADYYEAAVYSWGKGYLAGLNGTPHWRGY